MNCGLQKYITHQSTYFIIIYIKTCLKIQELQESNKYIKSYQQNRFEFLEKYYSYFKMYFI